MTNLLDTFNKEQMAKLKNDNIDNFRSGDTVSVDFEVYDNGVYIRNQTFEGVCIAKRNRGLHSSFTLRKISFNEGVERSFEFYSPYLKSARVKRYGIVRRAKLYYLRKLKGKAARIPERKITINKK
ncbi:50S ribosomal subunit protein L19 [Candidatus Xenohaliotis californiensis]|uniref:Large ribosomal subunit protein bL19 n=1 Tax=Candidatus Xenohaliotis californiensis TaxID=84677 RepID=A0ABM9N8L3_9RICK|nr:50S ribosomal subunit protein L19 [Candidatus Xenohaliotis californiensis]